MDVLKKVRKYFDTKKYVSYREKCNKRVSENTEKQKKEFEEKKAKYVAVESCLPPLPHIEFPEMTSYHSFSGSNLLCFFGDELVKELGGITYKDTLEGIKGQAVFPFFDEELRTTLESLKSSKPFDILLVFLNEEGNGAISMLKNVEFLSWSYGFSIDDVIFEISATFKAEKLFPFKNLPKLIKDNPGSLDKEVTLLEILNNEDYRVQYVNSLKKLLEKGGKSISLP